MAAKEAVNVKYTVQSTGIWETIRKVLSVDPNRSNGIPLNRQFRNPPPGTNDPLDYDDPVTLPAADIADNPYWKRDIRRNYPRLSVVNQADMVGLLSVGSKVSPREGVELIGEAGTRQLVRIQHEGQEKGLAAVFQNDPKSSAAVLGPDGMPPLPTGLSRLPGGKKYALDQERVQGFPER
ncbi:MAG: hypothetical protein M1829_000886 [Trizodia sp. TS-e1964]|nr:MAG: hypothetical protein M1829_000886 [Trizodia sp. TS-e1964]